MPPLGHPCHCDAPPPAGLPFRARLENPWVAGRLVGAVGGGGEHNQPDSPAASGARLSEATLHAVSVDASRCCSHVFRAALTWTPFGEEPRAVEGRSPTVLRFTVKGVVTADLVWTVGSSAGAPGASRWASPGRVFSAIGSTAR